jgi:hypothetical protein
MEKMECSFKVLSASDIEKNKEIKESTPVFLSKEELENVKKLMFSALEDPRAKYKVINDDEMVEYWKNPYGC